MPNDRPPISKEEPDAAPLRLARVVEVALPVARARAEIVREMREAHEAGDTHEVFRLAGLLTGRTPLQAATEPTD